MGNKQSQSSDEEEREPSYKYHENVLRDAQLLTNENSSVTLEIPVYESDNEEYFSAEEWDSDRSITPPRTRPESSSGEDFSDDSMSEEEEQLEQEAVSVLSQSSSKASSPSVTVSPRGQRVLRSNKTCGRCNVSRFEEYDSISAELETSRWHLNDSSLASNRSFTTSGQALVQRSCRGTPMSPFVPIRSPPSSPKASNSGANQSLNLSSTRNMSQISGGEESQTIKGMQSEQTGPRKRGLGYFDSSDSDDSENTTSRVSRRRKRHSRSPRCATTPAHRIGIESTRGVAGKFDTSGGDCTSLFTRPKQRKVIDKQALSKVIASPVKRPHSQEQLEWESTVKRTRGCNDPEVQLIDIGSGDRNVDSEHADEIVIPVNTSKMGSSGTRNSQGKLLPRHRRTDTDQTHESHLEKCQSDASGSQDLSPLSGIERNLRQGNKIRNERTLIVQHDRNNSYTGSPPVRRKDEAGQAGKNTSPKGLLAINPLASVVLTPLSPNATVSLKQTQQGNGKSPITLASRLKQKQQSAAQRFKNFGANFKTIFSSKSKSILPEKTTKHSSKAGSQTSLASPSTSNLFSESNHMHFSSSPAEPSCSRPAARSQSSNRPTDSASPSSLNSVSPIFASLPASSPSTRLEDQKIQRYSSILEMSAEARKRDSQSQGRTPTRKSPRFLHSNSKSPPVLSLPSSTQVQMLPQESQYQVLHFRLADLLEVSVSMGDIADETSAGIVNWTDESLSHAVTECSQRIAARAGALMRAGCADYLANKGAALEAPDVLTTPAGGRFPKSVEALLHVVSPKLMKAAQPAHTMTAQLLEVYANCLRFADERLGLRSLSLPLIGQDLFTVEVAAKTFIDSILIFLVEGKSTKSADESLPSFNLTSIQLVVPDATSTDLAAEVLTANLHHIASEGIENAAKEAFSAYYNKSTSTSYEMETIDRARSGRPRSKRPKL